MVVVLMKVLKISQLLQTRLSSKNQILISLKGQN